MLQIRFSGKCDRVVVNPCCQQHPSPVFSLRGKHAKQLHYTFSSHENFGWGSVMRSCFRITCTMFNT